MRKYTHSAYLIKDTLYQSLLYRQSTGAMVVEFPVDGLTPIMKQVLGNMTFVMENPFVEIITTETTVPDKV